MHARGGRIFVQLWHVGRISHLSLLPGGQAPVSSTARAAQVNTLTPSGRAPRSTPRALRIDEIPGVVAEYCQAALIAIEAGFDGVEVHVPTATCWTSFCATASTTARMPMAAPSRTARGCWSR